MGKESYHCAELGRAAEQKRESLMMIPFSNCFLWLGYFLFFLMQFVPFVYQPIKGALLAIIMPISIRSLNAGRLALQASRDN
jgi:hypothetical protein